MTSSSPSPRLAARVLFTLTDALSTTPRRLAMMVLSTMVVAGATVAGFLLPEDSATQTLTYRVVILASLAGIVVFIAVYSKLAPWWRNPIGRTIVYLDIELGLALLPVALRLFFHFSRLTSEMASAVDLAAITSIPVTMAWRIWVWLQMHRLPGQNGNVDG